MYVFTVYCDDIFNNPVPYKRTTTASKYIDPEYKRYQEWSDHTYASFVKQFKKVPNRCFTKNKKYYLDIMVYFKDKRHGDIDNIYKGILDSIFRKPLSDKYIAGFHDYDYDDNPRVEITIYEPYEKAFDSSSSDNCIELLEDRLVKFITQIRDKKIVTISSQKELDALINIAKAIINSQKS